MEITHHQQKCDNYWLHVVGIDQNPRLHQSENTLCLEGVEIVLTQYNQIESNKNDLCQKEKIEHTQQCYRIDFK